MSRRTRMATLAGVLAAALVGFALWRLAAPRRPGPDIVLIVVDTLRADHLGSYGSPRPTSPRLDALAEGGVRFADATSTSSWTIPSVASYLTGRLPVTHRMLDYGDVLDPALPYLPEELAHRGYFTLGISGNPGISRQAGFARGFQFWAEAVEEERLATRGMRSLPAAADITDMAIDALDQVGDVPCFLYLHYMDPHGPYVLPEDAEDRFASDDYYGFVVADLPTIRSRVGERNAAISTYFWGKVRPGEEDLQRLRELYDAKVLYADLHIGRLLDHLETSGRADHTVVVVTADHGEALGQHGAIEHGEPPFQHQVHVPLLMAGPGLPAGDVFDDPVELLDLPAALSLLAGSDGERWADGDGNRALPTALAANAVDAAEAVDAAGAAGGTAGDDSAIAVLHQQDARSVRLGPHKLIRIGDIDQVFDLDADPGELTDLAGQDPTRDQALRDALDRRLEPWLPFADFEAGTGTVDRETREMLRALGYVP